jgi:hypothetical protein
MDMETFKKRTGTLSENARTLSPGLHIPGEGSYGARKKYLDQGYIDLEDSLVEKLNAFALEFDMTAL